MKQHFKVIRLQDIDDNKLYNLHPFLEEAQLDKDTAQSVRDIGLLTPPVVLEKESDRYEVICGRRRIQCIKTLNENSCYCQLLPYHCPPETLLTVILEDQFAKGPLTLLEQAFFIKICKQLLPRKISQNEFIHRLLPGRIMKGTHFLSLLTELDKSVQSAIHRGLISEKSIKEVLHFSNKDQQILLTLLESIQFGANNQRKLITQLIDILKRNDVSLATFIQRDEIQKILLSSNLNRGEKSSRLLEYVKHQYQPLLTSAQDSFEQQVKDLKLPENIAILPSSSFETDCVTLHIRFRSLENFKKTWHNIAHHLNDTTKK